ncbi:phage head closure protein [Acuticoccus mangrovi]|uniref:Phage head closure protein n=1 Tax=Acuticoccus mangrovi TaxID=2796142 RepID=A0A934MGC4_9HYPH|nr:phage head closure protein [Acuticoccus mangrovi]MBJ3774821.1 phage head closure protein [Acuticoccus mangrovi]
MTPRIGELRRRIDIEAAVETADGAGGVSRTYEVVASVFGRVEARRRRETVDDGRAVGVVTHRVTMRRRADVTGGVRLVVDGTRYRVLAVEDEDPQRRFLRCLCEEEQR